MPLGARSAFRHRAQRATAELASYRRGESAAGVLERVFDDAGARRGRRLDHVGGTKESSRDGDERLALSLLPVTNRPHVDQDAEGDGRGRTRTDQEPRMALEGRAGVADPILGAPAACLELVQTAVGSGTVLFVAIERSFRAWCSFSRRVVQIGRAHV